MSPEVIRQLLDLGVNGLLLLAVAYLVRQNAKLNEKNDALHAARLQDLRENAKVVLEVNDRQHEALTQRRR